MADDRKAKDKSTDLSPSGGFDSLSVAGLSVGIGGILVGMLLEGGRLGSLVNLPALLIVLGGTVGAVMLQSPLPVFRRALELIPWIFFPPPGPQRLVLEKLLDWSNLARRDGLLGLEMASETEADPFTRKGLQLLVDGAEPPTIRHILEVELELRENRDLRAAKVYESMGGYSPTIGIIGAVMGLIHVMNNLSDPSTLGGGIATAFVATIYGVSLANLFFLPVANKLKALIIREVDAHQMIVDGLISIASGDNPRSIETKLQSYFD